MLKKDKNVSNLKDDKISLVLKKNRFKKANLRLRKKYQKLKSKYKELLANKKHNQHKKKSGLNNAQLNYNEKNITILSGGNVRNKGVNNGIIQGGNSYKISGPIVVVNVININSHTDTTTENLIFLMSDMVGGSKVIFNCLADITKPSIKNIISIVQNNLN